MREVGTVYDIGERTSVDSILDVLKKEGYKFRNSGDWTNGMPIATQDNIGVADITRKYMGNYLTVYNAHPDEATKLTKILEGINSPFEQQDLGRKDGLTPGAKLLSSNIV